VRRHGACGPRGALLAIRLPHGSAGVDRVDRVDRVDSPDEEVLTGAQLAGKAVHPGNGSMETLPYRPV
jgi:hypothetical protein